jgi:hypothetical protein
VTSDHDGIVPPPIRYPLPTLVVVVVVAALAWRGEGWIRGAFAAIAAPLKKVVKGPDYPQSQRPQVFAGSISRKVLRLREDVPIHPRPAAAPSGSFRARGFSDLYDVWPLSGPPEHLRIGNDKLVGWVAAIDGLPWDTRLVVRVPAGSIVLHDSPKGGAEARVDVGAGSLLPALEWTDKAIKVAVWDSSEPWSKVARVGWIAAKDLPRETWEVLLTESEVVALRRAARRSSSPDESAKARLQAILGLLLSDQTLSADDLRTLRSALPAHVVSNAGGSQAEPDALLTPTPAAASWGGLSFRAVPVGALP